MYNVIIYEGTKKHIRVPECLEVFARHIGELRISHTITDVDSAMELLNIKGANIIIMDTDIEEPNGFSLLKSLNNTSDPPCVILTGEKRDFDTVKKALVLGAFDYLVKPISEDELFQTLKRAIDKFDRRYKKSSSSKTDGLCLDIADCILDGSSDLDIKINMLLDADAEISSEHEEQYSTKLKKSAEKIYGMICRQHNWISDLIPSPELFLKDIPSANICEIDDLLQVYIYGLYGKVRKYSTTGLNGVTKIAVEYVLDNRFSKLTLADTAKNCFVNKTHLSHIFKQNLGLSFTEYVSGLKMDMLRKLMISSTKQLSEIAEILGYDDYKYMGRIFKSTYGITPSDFRNAPYIIPITE